MYTRYVIGGGQIGQSLHVRSQSVESRHVLDRHHDVYETGGDHLGIEGLAFEFRGAAFRTHHLAELLDLGRVIDEAEGLGLAHIHQHAALGDQHLQVARQRLEIAGIARRDLAALQQGVERSDGGVTAQIHLDRWGKVAHMVLLIAQFLEERGLGVAQLCRGLSHGLVVGEVRTGGDVHDARGIAAEDLVCKCVYDIKFHRSCLLSAVLSIR